MDTTYARSQPLVPAQTLRLLVAVGAAGLFAFGVFCWIAANWSAFHRLTRLGLVGALLLAAAVAAVLAPRARIPALLVATAAVGGLLALIGQIYPSGADAWELFAYWALLALPFALAARHDSVWVLWALVADAAIGLWRAQESAGLAVADFAPAWALAIGLALAFAPLAPLRTVVGRTDWAFRLASLGAVALVAFTGLEGLFLSAARGDAPLLASLLVLLAAAGGLLLLRPLEFGVLTMVFAGLDALLIGRIFKALAPNGPDIGMALLIGLIATAIVGGSVALLRAVHAHAARAQEAAEKDGFSKDGFSKDGFSWPLAALSGFGALLAAVPFLILYGLVFGIAIEKPAGAATAGALTLGAAIFTLRGGAPFGFRQMFGFIAATVGAALIGYAAVRAFSLDAGFILAAIGGLAAWLTPVRWARALFGFATLPAFAGSVFAHAAFSHLEPAVVATTIAVAAGAAALAFVASRADALQRSRPFFAGWSAAGLLALIAVAGRPFLASAGAGAAGELGQLIQTPWNGPALAVSVALGVAGAGFLFWRRADLRTPLGFAVAACAVALTFRSPALGAAIVVFAAAIAVESRSLAAAAALAIIWIVSAFYYALAWPLTQKAYVLTALGAALGLVVFLTRARGEKLAVGPRFAGPATALIALGAVATLSLSGLAARDAEQVLRDGRVVYLALRPVDPRSLLQGDYMALAFDTAGLPTPRGAPGEALALAEVDARSVATIRELAPAGAQPASNQIVLKLRPKSGRWFVGSDAFYFEEGKAADYAKARFGRFRVGPDGRMLLTGLADQDLKPLP